MSIKTAEFANLTYAEWYQQIEKPRLAAIPADVRKANDASHFFGPVDDCIRCLDCEILVTNGWQQPCPR